jgi:hypothetical protein
MVKKVVSVLGIVIVGIPVLIAVGVVLYGALVQPWASTWGATAEEAAMALPGDDLAPESQIDSTRAISVKARPEEIYPWMVQVGQGRGGMFSYDGLENLVGCNIHTLNTIIPELQDLQVGDRVMLGEFEQLPYYRVIALEADFAVVLQSVDPESGELSDGTWVMAAVEQGDGTSRLIMRHKSLPAADGTGKVVNAVFGPISFLMEQKMMRTLRDFAEDLNTGQAIASTVWW